MTLEPILHWIRYNADGPWWCYMLIAAGVVTLGVVVAALIREEWF